MSKEKRKYGLQNHKIIYCYGSLMLLLLIITSCKSNQYAINSNEVDSIHFWFVGEIDTHHDITDCTAMLYMQDNHDTIITDRKVIERYVSIINRSKPINPNLRYDIRVSSLIKMKQVKGEKRLNIKLCFGDHGRRVLLNGVLMKGKHKELWKFVEEVLYAPLTPYDWLPDFLKDYIRENPEERSKYLPDE